MEKKTDYEMGRVRRKRILWDAGIRKGGRPPKGSEPLAEECCTRSRRKAKGGRCRGVGVGGNPRLFPGARRGQGGVGLAGEEERGCYFQVAANRLHGCL